MINISDKEDTELESRISNLIELVENQPDEWYKLLIERVVKQEVALEKLTKKVDEFKKFEQINSAVIDNKLLASPTALKDIYEIKARNDLLPDQGFYATESTEDNLQYRWTKQNFGFEIPINRESNKKIHLHILSAIKPELLEDIKCYENGVEILLEKLPAKYGYIFEGVLEEAAIVNNTKLSFGTVKSFSPKDLNSDMEDSRELAVTFIKLIID